MRQYSAISAAAVRLVERRRRPPRFCHKTALAAATALALAGPGYNATASVVGSLGNFDVVNDTGKVAHGFEIDLDGIAVSDVTDTFGGAGRYFPSTVERYGAPTISATATGVKIVYQSALSGGAWSVGTPSGVFTTPGESCWTGGAIGYGPSTPCDHFGVGTRATPSKTTYSWLTETSPGSGTLTPVTASIPAPVINVTPPVVPAAPPQVAAVVPAPPPEGGAAFGSAIWVKVFTTELNQPVALEDLVAGNGIVPQNAGEVEVEWSLLQANLVDEVAEVPADAGVNAAAELRRYEFYQYIGGFSPEGEALSDTAVLSGPGINVGAFLGDQNLAANLNGVYDGPPLSPIPTPEPAALVLMATALAGLAAMRRR